jgi:predicted nucleotidyltransferase
MPFKPYTPFPNTAADVACLVTMHVSKHHPEISYVGLFGSFAKGEQHLNSDIDIVVGYRTPSPADPIWRPKDLEREFEQLSDRVFDIVCVRDNELPRLKKAIHGLLEGLQIYEQDLEWFTRNQALALRHLEEQEKCVESLPDTEFIGQMSRKRKRATN